MEISFQKTGGPILPKWLWILICTQLIAASLAKNQCIRCGDFNRIQPQDCVQDYKQCGDCLPNYVEDPEDLLSCHSLGIVDHPDEEEKGWFAASLAKSQCIRCEAFNRIQPQGCPQDITECGNCLPNYVEDPEDRLLCYTLAIVACPDKEIILQNKDEVFLACKFSAKVRCKWSKDGEEVKDIGTGSNRQWKTGNGEITDDCSLVISRLSAADVGNWTCSSMVNGHFKAVSSRPTRVYIYPKVVMHPKEEITQEVNKEVYLACKFDTIVNCKWSIDGVEVTDIGPESNSQWMDRNGNNTDDCGLIINSLSPADEGSWVCSNRDNGHFKEMSSRPSQVYIYLMEPLIYYRDKVVNGAIELYPGKEAMVGLNCRLPSSVMAKKIKLRWILTNEGEYQAKVYGNVLQLGHKLIAAIDEKLHQGNEIKLVCMAEDEFRQVSTAIVVFVSGHDKPFKKQEPPHTPFHRDIPSHHDIPDRPKIPVDPYANLIGDIFIIVVCFYFLSYFLFLVFSAVFYLWKL